jgi:hypothetical protein
VARWRDLATPIKWFVALSRSISHLPLHLPCALFSHSPPSRQETRDNILRSPFVWLIEWLSLSPSTNHVFGLVSRLESQDSSSFKTHQSFKVFKFLFFRQDPSSKDKSEFFPGRSSPSSRQGPSITYAIKGDQQRWRTGPSPLLVREFVAKGLRRNGGERVRVETGKRLRHGCSCVSFLFLLSYVYLYLLL